VRRGKFRLLVRGKMGGIGIDGELRYMPRGLFWVLALPTNTATQEAYKISRGISLGDSSRPRRLFGPIKSVLRIGGFSLS
jgi:hypothetical protein